jgi:hypothetical protein
MGGDLSSDALFLSIKQQLACLHAAFGPQMGDSSPDHGDVPAGGGV